MPNPLSPEEDKERRRLHGEGLSDEEIAAQRGVTRAAIVMCRIKNNIPTNNPRKPNGECLLLTLALWHEGFSDKEMEPIIGHHPGKERQRLGLPPNTKCQTCNEPIPSGYQFCDEHRASDDGGEQYFIASRVLGDLSKCIGDDYHHARDLALKEWPWLSESIDRWEADGRIGPVPTYKTNGRNH